MKPVWKIKSGVFYGWIDRNFLYNPQGLNVGYLKNTTFYKLSGQYLGDLYKSDRIGIKLGEYHDSGTCENPNNPIATPNPPDSKDPIFEYGWDEIKE